MANTIRYYARRDGYIAIFRNGKRAFVGEPDRAFAFAARETGIPVDRIRDELKTRRAGGAGR